MPIKKVLTKQQLVNDKSMLYDEGEADEFSEILKDKKARIKRTSEQPANFFENRPTPGVTTGGPGSGRYPKGSHQDIGEALGKKIGKNWDGAVKYYNSLSNTNDGRILNTDDARELSSAYRADRTRSAEVHEPASQFIKDLYKDKLANPTPKGLVPTVLFTAGGTGAGKSVSLRAADPQDLASKAEIVYDTNMNNVPSATTKINQALSAGRNVRIAYTYRDPVEAMTGGALPRAMRMGRTVPLAEHIKTHVGAYATISSLQKIYADNPKVEFRLFDNSRGPGNAARVLTVDDLPKMADNGLERRLHEALDQARTSGRISEAVYQGTLGKGLGRAVGVQSESKRVSRARAGTARSSTVNAGGPGSGRYPKGSGKQKPPTGRDTTGRIFVSPNIDEGTKLDQALTALQSDRQKRFEAKAQEVTTAVLGKGTVHPAVGVWADGAENSSEIRTSKASPEAQQYLGALLGKAANQKAVLNWTPSPSGSHTLYAIQSGDSLDTLNSKFDKAGIEFRTIEASADGKSSTAFVLDQDGSLAAKVQKFGEDNRYETTSRKGTGDFVGSWDTRDEGLAEYNKIIRAYELSNPSRKFTGNLEFAGRLRAGIDGRGIRDGAGSDLYRDRRIQAAYAVNPIQASVAKFMRPGLYRVCGNGFLVVTADEHRAKMFADRRAEINPAGVTQVYDNTGSVIYAAGGL